MDGTLALALYRAGARARRGAADAPPPPPPGAPVVWLHAPQPGPGDDADPRTLGTLAARLAAARHGLALILTQAAPGDPGRSAPGLLRLTAAGDDLGWARAAFAAWSPALMILGPGPLPPALIAAAQEARRPILAIGGRTPEVATRWAGLPGLKRGLVRRPARIFVGDGAGARAHRRAGALPDRVEVIGPLARLPGPLSHTAAERAVLTRRLGARPLWLAACVPPDEEAAVLAAQRIAQRLAHRLLLVLVPADPARGPDLVRAAAAQGLRAVRRAAEQEPDDDTHLYIADTEGELGLWYRLAPVTFCGGTLSGGATCDPLEATALGSAVVHGPATGARADDYARLVRARASWSVPGLTRATPRPAPGRLRGALLRRSAPPPPDPDEDAGRTLSEAVTALLSPERAARLARAGWDVATEGAEATERVVDRVLATLDAAEGQA